MTDRQTQDMLDKLAEAQRDQDHERTQRILTFYD